MFVCHSFHLWMVLIYEEFRKGRCRVLKLGRKNPSTSKSWNNCKAAWQEKTWGFGIWTKLNVSHQPVLVAGAANWAVSWAAGGSVSCRLREGIQDPASAQPQPAAMPGPAPLGWAGGSQLCTRETLLKGPGSVRWGWKRSKETQKGPHPASVKWQSPLKSKKVKNPTINPEEETTCFGLKVCFGKKAAQWCRIKWHSAFILANCSGQLPKPPSWKNVCKANAQSWNPALLPWQWAPLACAAAPMWQQEGAWTQQGMWSSGGETHYHFKAEEWPNEKWTWALELWGSWQICHSKFNRKPLCLWM